MKKLKLEELGRPALSAYKEMPKLPLCIVLNDIRSMLNVGSIFRTCDAFLVEKLYLCGITGSPPHREIQKTALGATESVAWEYRHDAAGLLLELKEAGYTIAGLEQTASSVMLQDFEISTGQGYAIVLGNEVDGISENLLPLLDFAVEIPQSGTKHSLNVSVAAGIAIHNFYEKMNGRPHQNNFPE